MGEARGSSGRAGLVLVALVAASAGCEEQAIMQPRATPDPPIAAAAPPPAGASATRLDLPEWHKNDQNPDNKLGQFAWENVDPKFVVAVAGYSGDLRQLVGTRVEVTAVARCLKSLGDALAAVPNPGPVDVKGMGEKIRAEAARAAGSAPAAPGAPAPQKEAIKAALTVASSAFAELGRGAYKADGVLTGARELEAAIPDITPLGALESHQSEIYVALQKVEPILRAIQVEAGKRSH